MTFRIRLFSGLLFLALPGLAKAQIGTPAPDFIVTDTHGETHSLYEYVEAGKVVVLDFFYTTCGPCQFYSPQVNLAYEKYGCNTANVIFMSIDYNDTDAEVLAYDQQFNIEYPSVSGLNGGGNAVVSAYGILGFPTFYIIDSSKTIIDQIDPPTLQVFDFRFQQHGILPAACAVSPVREAVETERLVLYPNPVVSGGSLFVQMPAPNFGAARLEILNVLGQTMERGQVEFAGPEPLEWKMEALTEGHFWVKITLLDGGKIIWGRFVAQ